MGESKKLERYEKILKDEKFENFQSIVR